MFEGDRDAIEKEIGEKLEWSNAEGVKHCKLLIRRGSTDLDNREAWPEYIEWLTDRLERFHEVFQPRILALKLPPETGEIATTS